MATWKYGQLYINCHTTHQIPIGLHTLYFTSRHEKGPSLLFIILYPFHLPVNPHPSQAQPHSWIFAHHSPSFKYILSLVFTLILNVLYIDFLKMFCHSSSPTPFVWLYSLRLAPWHRLYIAKRFLSDVSTCCQLPFSPPVLPIKLPDTQLQPMVIAELYAVKWSQYLTRIESRWLYW